MLIHDFISLGDLAVAIAASINRGNGLRSDNSLQSIDGLLHAFNNLCTICEPSDCSLSWPIARKPRVVIVGRGVVTLDGLRGKMKTTVPLDRGIGRLVCGFVEGIRNEPLRGPLWPQINRTIRGFVHRLRQPWRIDSSIHL